MKLLLGAAVSTLIPRYHFNLFNDETVKDPEGTVLPTDGEALQATARMAREMAAKSVRSGRLVLDHRIEVTDEDGQLVGTVHFGDVVQVLAIGTQRQVS